MKKRDPRLTFPPGTDESDVRWIIYRHEGEKVAHIVEVADYMHRLKEPLPAHPANADPAVWVAPLDDRIHFGPMGVHVRASLLFMTREAAIRQRLRDLEEHAKVTQAETARWQYELQEETVCCPACGERFTTAPKRRPGDTICELCLDDVANSPREPQPPA